MSGYDLELTNFEIALKKFHWQHDIDVDSINLNKLIDLLDTSDGYDCKHVEILIRDFKTIYDISLEDSNFYDSIDGLGWSN
jgi:hypothetical protein